MERFPLNPNRWVEPLFMFGCRWSQSTPPSERQFKLVAQFSTMCGCVFRTDSFERRDAFFIRKRTSKISAQNIYFVMLCDLIPHAFEHDRRVVRHRSLQQMKAGGCAHLGY